MIKGLQKAHELMGTVRDEVHRRIVGMDDVIDHLLVAVFADGHVLLEGVPGTGKTYLINTLAQATNVDFKRIQMTPDLYPRDLWSVPHIKEDGKVAFLPGPIYTNFLLTDELNRTSPKVQSALLEAMQERQVTSEKGTEALSRPFLVFATQNPIEQEGTYPLSEAQEDRFLMKVFVGYPSHEETVRIATMSSEPGPVEKIMDGSDILSIQKLIEKEVRIDPVLVDKAVTMVELTRPENSDVSKENFSTGGSTRVPMALVRSAKALAVLRGRDYVLPEDLIELSKPVLCHRVVFEDRFMPDEYDSVFSEAMEEIIRQVFGWEGSNGKVRT
ncbi:MAG: MoxR family ATPase [Candidatus Spechtbacterales bacterium]